VLSAPARLTDVAPFAIRRTRKRFLVGDLRLADARLHAELALQAVDDDFEVQLAHAADDDLTGLLVGLDAERRALRPQRGEPHAGRLLTALRLRRDGGRDDWLREVHRLENDRLLLVAERVAGADPSEAGCRCDVPAIAFLDGFARGRVHLGG